MVLLSEYESRHFYLLIRHLYLAVSFTYAFFISHIQTISLSLVYMSNLGHCHYVHIAALALGLGLKTA